MEDTVEDQSHRFRLLPSYVAVIQQSNETPYIRLSSHQNTNCFQRLFICPAESRESFQHCRHFIAVDGTFLKSKFIQTLLLAVTIDANGHTLLLVSAVVESENTSSGENILINLQLAIPKITTEATTLLSDRDKALIAASEVLAPTVIRAFCCQHLKENFITRYGRGLATNFWSIARARTIAKYESAILALQEAKPAAAEYFQNIDPTLWIHAFFPGRRFGQDTSNIVESVNSALKLDREMSIVELLNSIWHKLMGQRFDRYQSASSPGEGVAYTKFCTTALGESRI